MLTTIKPYKLGSQPDQDIDKDIFIKTFVKLMFENLEKEDDYQRVCNISARLKTKSQEFLEKAFKKALAFEFVKDRQKSGNYYVTLKINVAKIKDTFADGLDGMVVSAARKQAHNDSQLGLIADIFNMSGTLVWRCNYSTKDNAISFVRPVEVPRTASKSKLVEIVGKTFRLFNGGSGACDATL